MGSIVKSIIIQKQAPIPYSSRMSFAGAGQNKQSKESYLRYYSEIGWLRAAVSVIAQSVAQTDWRLYQKHKDGDREEITGQHDLKDVLNRPNKFQSGHDLLELHQIFDELAGEVYWIKQRNQGSNELWLAPPLFMTPVPDNKQYISGYTYKRGEYEHTFKVEEVIAFIEPNPLDMMTGISKAQSVGIDIENQAYMSQYNRNFFYGGADAGTIIAYPPGASITPDELDKLNEQWNAGHRGYGRAHRAAILTQGATVTREGISHRDMDFANLAKYNREAILGVFGVSYAMLGGTEDVNRANAEAQLLNFARWVLMPRLIRIREKLNMFLTPDYGPDLELDFDSPVPEDDAATALIIDNHLRAGVISIEEARQELDMGEVEPDHHFLMPINVQIVMGQTLLEDIEPPEPAPASPPVPPQATPGAPGEEPPAEVPPGETPATPPTTPTPPAKAVKKKTTDAWKENFWKAYVKQAEAYEPGLIRALRAMYRAQRAEALANLENAVSRDHVLIDKEAARQGFEAAATPTLKAAITNALKNAMELVEPATPHKQDIPAVADKRALEWLLTRIGWAAAQTTEETAGLLAEALGAGFAAGESIPQIARRVRDVFENCSSVRARRIARTEVITASSQGALVGYDEAGLEAVEFYTALDERTCDICMSMHGMKFALDDAANIITGSTHPNCRCILLPVLD